MVHCLDGNHQDDALEPAPADPITDTRSSVHSTRQALLERLAQDGKAGCVTVAFGASMRTCLFYLLSSCFSCFALSILCPQPPQVVGVHCPPPDPSDNFLSILRDGSSVESALSRVPTLLDVSRMLGWLVAFLVANRGD